MLLFCYVQLCRTERKEVQKMSIVYDARRIKAYEGLLARGEYAGKDLEWLGTLWTELVSDSGLM